MGGWVGGKKEENEAVRMSYCGGGMGGWVVGWEDFLLAFFAARVFEEGEEELGEEERAKVVREHGLFH